MRRHRPEYCRYQWHWLAGHNCHRCLLAQGLMLDAVRLIKAQRGGVLGGVPPPVEAVVLGLVVLQAH